MKKYVLITGASAGLGKAMAIELARQGHHLILVSLPNENLGDLAHQIRISCNVQVAYYETDLCERPNIEALIAWIQTSQLAVFYLINNAGIGGSQAFEQSDTGHIERIIQLNIIGTALLTRLLLPFLLKFPQSYILNVSSMAAFSPFPYKTVYPASKAFIYSFSLGLRAELRAFGVQVSVVHPGPMPHTPENQARLQKHGRLGRMLTVPLEFIAQTALERVEQGQSVIIPGWTNKMGYWVSRWVPWSWRRPLMVSMLRKEVTPTL
ncbi:SDR family NAD(P)-dependent oxidoreductase [Larkinella rosea]|uniref:SDR family NAD(P)-dependent oxidoreductase n=1 Tax=Larkinella rosea TaxID=2025312 RepID=A0A3P1C0C9_9BACT|nr:SDR family NAD(P)-dependent oxidoreductase [Larkinella rosea]RRB06708.1 SDR family NAD(P)-dependent oxidoreductase [Larkinella rosea]